MNIISQQQRTKTMFIRKRILLMAVFAASILFIGACSSAKLNVQPIAKTENPTELINRLDNDIAHGRKNQLHVLAPTWFARAESSMVEAKKGLDQGAELSKILHNIAVGRAQLQSAEEMARLSRTTLADAIKGRDLARQAGAVKLGKDYAKVEEDFIDLTKAIENNNLRYAQKNRAKVTEAFRQLELRAIKIETIGEVRKLIKQAKDKGVEKIAPESFVVAQKKLTDTDAFITENPYQKEMMHKKANEALFMALRLFQVAEQSEKFRTMQPEQITLWVEEILYKTTSKLSATDMRDQPYGVQVENILGSIMALQNDRQFMLDKAKVLQAEIGAKNLRIAALEKQTREEQTAKERLAAEKRFNQLFIKVQNSFEADEAEVYKKGNLLIIRLRGIQFPVGKSVIMPNNYALLSKVQRAIRTFGEPDIIIEGHTDITGSDEINEHLSQQRSEAVRQYLVANKTLPYDIIVAVGYGSSRPLASNETEEGRAINRRIDIIITAKTESGQ